MTKKIQLYSLATPNGQKVSTALEEMEIEYDAHTINILENDQFSEDFININPNSKIPAIVVPKHGDKENFAIFESGAILIYLAELTGKFLSKDPAKRSETFQWLMFQMGGVGPMFGQFGHFHKYGKAKCDHPYPVARYTNEAKRLLQVLEVRMNGRDFIVGEVSIADFAIVPWVICLDEFYEASDVLELNKFPNVLKWVERMKNRPLFKKGLSVCGLS